MKKRILWTVILLLIVLISITACAEDESKTVHILYTSDTHGFFRDWYYFADENTGHSGLTRIASAVKAEREKDAGLIVLDGGDIFQDNQAQVFLPGSGYAEIHPMAKVMNAVGYDAWACGNHEFNWGMDELMQLKDQMAAPMLCANVTRNGVPIGQRFVILERNGLRIAVIGAVTPNIAYWDGDRLKDYEILDPAEEINRAITEIGDGADVFVALLHMGIENELGTSHSGCCDIAQLCPGVDVILSAHSHASFADTMLNGVLTVENRNYAQTAVLLEITVTGPEKNVNVSARVIDAADFEEDEDTLALTAHEDETAKQIAAMPVGVLMGGDLISGQTGTGICSVALEDTPWMQLIADCERYWSGADVCSVFAMETLNEVREGIVDNMAIGSMYPYNNNTLYLLSMTGAQLKTYLEWANQLYRTYQPGDLTVAYNEGIRFYNHHMLDGVNYAIDLSREPGSRIVSLSWPDGKPVREDDVFTLVVSDYSANSQLLVPGVIFGEGEELPVLLETDLHSEVGSMQQLLIEYIKSALGGVIHPSCDDNWHLTGCEWDTELHEEALLLIGEGLLQPQHSDDGRTPNIRPFTKKDLGK